jgi:GTPase SAR1 family protein
MTCIAAIKQRKKECEIRIGFLGGTGTGKTSLINAILRMDVLPQNQEISSTAVPVEVSYNKDDDPAHLFIAVIEGISRAEFTKLLQDLFEDKQSYDMAPDGEDAVDDLELRQRMQNTIEMIKWLYPNLELQKVEDLSKTSAEQLLKKPYVQTMLDCKKNLYATTEAEFAKAIRPYIESSKPREGDKAGIALWPLVKVVRIYVKADFLKTGIILVDLPGSHDTSAARVAVAENYRKHLTASIVCARAERAGSDKIAQDLLSSVERRNMQLDGLYTSESLFFVVTKIDDLEYKKYLRDHEDLERENKQDMEKILSTSQEIEKMMGALIMGETKKSKAEAGLKTMQTTHDNLAARVEKILGSTTPTGRKRKRGGNITGMSIILIYPPGPLYFVLLMFCSRTGISSQ